MPYQIEPALPEEHWLAQQLVCGGSTTESPDDSAEGGFGFTPRPATSTQFLVARGDGQLHAAVALEQRAPGLVSLGLPPMMAVPAALRTELFQAAVDVAQQAGRGLIAMFAPQDVVMAKVAAELDFQRVAEIAFQERALSEPLTDAPRDLTLHEASSAELTSVIDLTLCDSRDCPGLQPVMGAAEMLDGFEQRAPAHQRAWYRVERSGATVGCLLLNEGSGEGEMELAYMGVLPSARGRGLGAALVRAAIHLARARRCRRLMLAVDLSNAPALQLYAAAGFVEVGRRTLWLRIASRSGDATPSRGQ
ncbi:MAG: GNAT family N-acetyltransferase [Planctomycetota bacterium]